MEENVGEVKKSKKGIIISIIFILVALAGGYYLGMNDQFGLKKEVEEKEQKKDDNKKDDNKKYDEIVVNDNVVSKIISLNNKDVNIEVVISKSLDSYEVKVNNKSIYTDDKVFGSGPVVEKAPNLEDIIANAKLIINNIKYLNDGENDNKYLVIDDNNGVYYRTSHLYLVSDTGDLIEELYNEFPGTSLIVGVDTLPSYDRRYETNPVDDFKYELSLDGKLVDVHEDYIYLFDREDVKTACHNNIDGKDGSVRDFKLTVKNGKVNKELIYTYDTTKSHVISFAGAVIGYDEE